MAAQTEQHKKIPLRLVKLINVINFWVSMNSCCLATHWSYGVAISVRNPAWTCDGCYSNRSNRGIHVSAPITRNDVIVITWKTTLRMQHRDRIAFSNTDESTMKPKPVQDLPSLQDTFSFRTSVEMHLYRQCNLGHYLTCAEASRHGWMEQGRSPDSHEEL